MARRIAPTQRAVVLLAVAALPALLVAAIAPAAWPIVPMLAAAVLSALVVDGLLAGSPREWRTILPGDAEVGQPVTLGAVADFPRPPRRARFALECDPRLSPDGRIFGILPDGESGSVAATPTRRGPAAITRAWLSWEGPLGLAAAQNERALDHTVRIRPDLSPVRSPALQTLLRDAQFGLMARRLRGEGTQFESLAESEPGMDRRRIDWKVSARLTRLYARENEAERNNQIVFAFDCGQAMCEPVDGLPRLDRAITAALTATFVALKGGDKVALYGFARRPEAMSPFVADTTGFARLQTAAAELDYHAVEPNFTLALATLAARLQRRSLIVLFSDFADPTAAHLMVESVGRLVQRHLVVFVTLTDTEIEGLLAAQPDDVGAIGRAVAADGLLRQRDTVLARLRQLGVDVIQVPWEQLGFAVIDRYLAIKRSGRIG